MLTCDSVLIRNATFELRAHWHVRKGHHTALIGPSGSGKSTLIAAIAGFQSLAEGRILLNQNDITHLEPAQRGIAMLFQDGNLFPALTLAQNVGLGLRASTRLTTGERDNVKQALSHVGLSGLEDRHPSEVSGGQQSRAALARVLLQRKPLVLLDEPFAALGPALRKDMLDLLKDVLAETDATLLIVTHDPKDAEHIADDIIFVDEGIAQAPLPADELLANPTPALKRYLG